MALKNRILGWLRATPGKDEALEDAEVDEATKAYSAAKADDIAEHRLGTQPGEFEGDQTAPRP
ncbi:MAG: hypothetical protein M5U27_13085 [Gaiella sp.]|nr:hypothetical protein [Gaiella sp.]